MLSVIDKNFEKLKFEQLSNYIHENYIFLKRQYGFKKGSETEEALINVQDYICEGIDDGFKGVAGVFFDFSKTFDLVDHDILIKKLENIGLMEESICLMRDYLKNRKQYLKIGN